MKVVGIDLAGKSKNPSGFCFLTGKSVKTRLLYTDLEILKEIKEIKPQCIGIDAPFWIPKFQDRVTPWRRSEELLMKKDFHPLSIALPSMQDLSRRAMHLVNVLKKRKYKVIEVSPRATEKILGLKKEPRKNKDEYDSLLCALTAKAYLEGNYEDLDGIIIPK